MKSSKKTRTTHADRAFLRSAYSGFCWIPPVVRRLFEVNSEPHTGARNRAGKKTWARERTPMVAHNPCLTRSAHFNKWRALPSLGGVVTARRPLQW